MRLQPLIAPRSIAVLGASDRPSISKILTDSLDVMGFSGAVYPVNPKYPTVAGRPCFPSLQDLPDRPDVVAFCVGPERLPESLAAAAALGVPAGVVYAGGFAEHGADGARLQDEITALARGAGMALCGPNCMGVLNPHERSTTFMLIMREPDQLAGNVGLVSHSGSICIGLLGDIRRFGFSTVISAGNEAVLRVADYVDHLVEDPRTGVIALFIEAVRDAAAFTAALDRAAAADKPVVVLKVGRHERTRRAIASHSGGLAGEAFVLSAALRAHGAIEVADLDELTETVAALQSRRRPHGRRIAAVTGSGGQAELVLDIAMQTGIELPPLNAAERADAESVIGPLGGDGNPLDYWGTGDYQRNLAHALGALQRSGRFGAVVFCNDAFEESPMGSKQRAIDYARLFAESASGSSVAHYYMNTRPGVMNRSQIAVLREAGIAVLGGIRQGLGAVDRVARWAAPRLPERPPRPPRSTTRLAELASPGRRYVNEVDAKRLLGAHGMPVARERVVASLDAARDAAASIGYPVVLKAVADELPHKSDHGLVLIDLRDQAALDAAWAALAARIASLPSAAGVATVVQEMVRGDVELFAGVLRDPQFGPVLLCGMGGIHVEVLRDFSVRLLPLRQGDAEAMIAELRGAPLLGALRGRPALDVAALADCLYALGDFAMAERTLLAELDLNPIKLLPDGQGCRIVDALITLHQEGEPSS